jgi:hypothetical protein
MLLEIKIYFKTKPEEIVVKRIFMATMIVALSNSAISATSYYQSLCSRISGLGQSIENVNNIPVIGKLTNILPMAMLAASLKECPMQTMMVLAALGGYLMSQNPVVQEMMDQYDILNNVPWLQRNNNQYQPIDENIFVFDGDDSDDSDDDDDDSLEEMLNEDLLDKKKLQARNEKQAFL